MAYLDIDALYATPVGGQARLTPTSIRTFSALEWSVIALAKRDCLSSLRKPGRVSRALSSLFGLRTASSLADPRLEALRRVSVHAWLRGFALPEVEVAQFLDAGFVKPQLEALLASVTGIRIVPTA